MTSNFEILKGKKHEAEAMSADMGYLKTDEVPSDLIEQVITAATWAPSPEIQGRDFVIVTDRKRF